MFQLWCSLEVGPEVDHAKLSARRYEERLEVEMRRFRAVEATSIRLEEANRCAREMKQARADMDRWHEQARGERLPRNRSCCFGRTAAPLLLD